MATNRPFARVRHCDVLKLKNQSEPQQLEYASKPFSQLQVPCPIFFLGVHIIGPRAGDLIAEAAVAVEFGASGEDLARASHAHPTLAEVIKEAALAVTLSRIASPPTSSVRPCATSSLSNSMAGSRRGSCAASTCGRSERAWLRARTINRVGHC